jgi:lipoprotein-anchoring transpeptidase ErfK/SrfK
MYATRAKRILIGSATFVTVACTVSMKDDTRDTAAAAAAAPPEPPIPAPVVPESTVLADSVTPVSSLRVEVDLTARRLRLFEGADSVKSYRVGVGSQRWPTQTGDWKITQVVWNPEWNPPDESWAEEREPREPGDPKNPLGRVQLVYDPPRTVHGTPDRTSIGKAVSHGSIRMLNEEAAELGRRLMESAGVGRDSAFYRNVERNRTEKVVVNLPGGVPIRVF